MKPRLSEAPNGIVGASGSLPRARGDLIGLAAPSASHATHSATTLPVELLSSANSVGSAPRTSVAPSAPKPTAARAPLAGSTNERSSQQGGLRNSHGRHRRTLSDSQSSSPNLNTSPRGSNRLKNVGPLQQDTRQQELVEKAVEEQRGASASGSGKRESIFYTLRAKNTRVRAPSNPNPFESMDSESTGTFSDGSSGASLDGRRGGSRKAVAGLFARASGSRTVDVPRKQQWPEQGPVSIVAGAAGGHKPGGAAAGVAAVSQPPQPEKRVGFLAKLMGRNKKTGPAAAPAAAAKPARFVFTAAELEAREAQLAAAGFSQLPGTLLSRAKGEALDPKYLMKWHQFDLKREIGEGAYAMVYLAAVGVPGGGTKDVALKELKLLGNEQSEDMHLEAAAVVDAISDCGFKTLAEAVRLGAELIRQRATYSDAKTLLRAALLQFRDCADMEDEACVQIVAVMEGLVALPPPPEQLTVPAGKTAAQRLVEDIMREVEVLSKLWHKNIVEFVGACVDLPHLAIAMQFAHKGPLSELLINDEVVMGWDLRVRWARETAEALDYLHSLDPKVIHRDLKADNILIDKNDRALVTDFGLSKAKGKCLLMSRKSEAGKS